MAPAIKLADIVQQRTSCLIEAIYVHFSTTRILISSLSMVGMIVWVANVSEGSNNPSQTLDALSIDPRAYSNKNILIMEPVPVPPILASGDLLSATTNEEIRTSKYTYQASRKLDRAQQILCMQVNADVDSVVSCFIQYRVLLSYGAS